jgi:hypothetical protein
LATTPSLTFSERLWSVQPRDEVLRGVDVEHAGLQRHDDVVGQLHHRLQAFAVQARRRVQHDVGGALGRAHDVVAVEVPALYRWQRVRAQLQPQAGRLLAIDVAQHDLVPLAGEIARDVARQRGLADAALGVGHHDHRHGWDSCVTGLKKGVRLWRRMPARV